MKSKLIGMLKCIVIPFGLMWATGLPGFIRSINLSSNDPYPHGAEGLFTHAELATLELTPENFWAHTDSLKKNREEIAKHNKYTPFVYFRDLKQLDMFKAKFYHQLDTTMQGRNILISIQTEVTNKLFDISWRQKKSGLTDATVDIDKARSYWFPEKEKKTKVLAETFSWTTSVLMPVLYWMLRVYLRGLPFAFMLFLIWKLNRKKEFLAPVSFLFSIIVWPIVLGIDIRNRFNQVLMGADVVSRRNSLFTLFSKQEQQLLEFGKRMTTIEFGEHLDSLGMERKHSFASALCVTLFLIIIPASLFPQTTSVIHKEKVIMMKSDYGGGGIHYDVVAKSSAVLNYGDDVKQFPEFTKRIFFNLECLYEYIFSADVGKVPLVTNRIALILI